MNLTVSPELIVYKKLDFFQITLRLGLRSNEILKKLQNPAI